LIDGQSRIMARPDLIYTVAMRDETVDAQRQHSAGPFQPM
jgi:hypothetical protein